jgi:hypothetical protein
VGNGNAKFHINLFIGENANVRYAGTTSRRCELLALFAARSDIKLDMSLEHLYAKQIFSACPSLSP